MTIYDEPSAPIAPAPASPRVDDTRLRRSRTRRMLAGVAGGLADRFDIDVSLVRVAFVVAACAWGFGLIVYLAMWALVPKEAAVDGVTANHAAGEPTSSWLAAVLLGGVLVFGLLVATSWWRGPSWGGGLSLSWILFLGILAIASLRHHDGSGSRGASIGRVLVLLGVGIVTVAIVVTGTFLALVASTGVPFSGGVGDHVYQPATLAQVQPAYRASIGNLMVDLRRVHFTHTTEHVTASVAVGVVTVEVPPGVVVDVSAHSGLGNVVASPGDLQSFSAPTGATAAAPQLVLVAEAGVGQVRLLRASPS
jgi:phage shock protein PspC (stress-responsive transcriptional regulator)